MHLDLLFTPLAVGAAQRHTDGAAAVRAARRGGGGRAAAAATVRAASRRERACRARSGDAVGGAAAAARRPRHAWRPRGALRSLRGGHSKEGEPRAPPLPPHPLPRLPAARACRRPPWRGDASQAVRCVPRTPCASLAAAGRERWRPSRAATPAAARSHGAAVPTPAVSRSGTEAGPMGGGGTRGGGGWPARRGRGGRGEGEGGEEGRRP